MNKVNVTIYPSAASGRVAAPPSKSMAHRMLICAGLAGGVSTVRGISPSQDILATSGCLETLGARMSACRTDHPSEKTIQLKSDKHRACDDAARKNEDSCLTGYGAYMIEGCDPRMRMSECFDCRESGSTLRFMIPLAAMSGRRAVFRGSETLFSRPLSVYEELFRKNGLRFERNNELPVYRKGEKEGGHRSDNNEAGNSGLIEGLCLSGILAPGEYTMDGGISSQFVSGMLFALSVTEGESIIRLLPPVESKPYIDMTVAALREFGAKIQQPDELTIQIQGRKTLSPRDCTVEGDWSNAAFLLALGADVTGLDNESLQGDRVCKELFRQLDRDRAEIDIRDCPDLGPVLMAYAAMRHGAVLHGAGRLRIKESDRGAAMKQELAKFGVPVDIRGDDIRVGCGVRTPSEMLDGHNDHRIVMSMAVLCAGTGGTIAGAKAVNKSYPDFFDDIRKLGIRFAEA